MPILLTTPGDPGDNDPGVTYLRAKIDRLNINLRRKNIDVDVSFGDLDGEEWTPGKGLRLRSFVIEGEDYDTMVGELSNDGEKVYDAIKRLLYEWLQINHDRFAGTVE